MSHALLIYGILFITIVLLSFKLAGTFAISWWIVFSPVIGYVALVGVVLLCAFLFLSRATRLNLWR